MKVNFNNARKQACFSFNRLVSRLNDYIEDGVLTIEADEVDVLFDNLRMNLSIIAITFQKDNDEFADLSKDIGTLAIFNPESEDNDDE